MSTTSPLPLNEQELVALRREDQARLEQSERRHEEVVTRVEASEKRTLASIEATVSKDTFDVRRLRTISTAPAPLQLTIRVARACTGAVPNRGIADTKTGGCQ